MKTSFVLAAAALVLPAGGCMMKPRHLIYPQGVTFQGWYVPNFETCCWRQDPRNPRPCPLVVHRAAGDLGDKELSDPNALRRAGWEEQDLGGGLVVLREPGPPSIVACAFANGVLTDVAVSVLSGGTAEVSVGGNRVALPGTDEAITAALGQPLRRE